MKHVATGPHAWRKKPMNEWTSTDEDKFIEHLMNPVIMAMTDRIKQILKACAKGTEAPPDSRLAEKGEES